MNFIAYQIKRLVAQRIMVKTTSWSDCPWYAIFCVIVYSACLWMLMGGFSIGVTEDTCVFELTFLELHKMDIISIVWNLALFLNISQLQLALKATHDNQLKVNKGQITTIVFGKLIGLSSPASNAELNSLKVYSIFLIKVRWTPPPPPTSS